MPPRDKAPDPEFERIHERLDLVLELLQGNGTPEKGLVVRVDRLEQSKKTRDKVIGAATVAAVGALIKSWWTTLTGHQS